MLLPIIIQRWSYRDFKEKKLRSYCMTHVMLELFNRKTKVHTEIWLAIWLATMVFFLPRAWNRLAHRYYYGRLDYQYECGLADGRREVLENPETYKDLTPQEFQAAIARPEHQ